MVWAENRETTCKEDKAYSLLGILDIHMPLIYGEGREKALKRLQGKIEEASEGKLLPITCIHMGYMKMHSSAIRKILTRIGTKREDFSVSFSLSDVPEIEQFVAREEELAEIHRTLRGDGDSRRTVVLHGLGGIGKTQLAIAYAKGHKDSYSAVFWLNIKDEDSLKQSFAKAAKRISREHPG